MTSCNPPTPSSRNLKKYLLFCFSIVHADLKTLQTLQPSKEPSMKWVTSGTDYCLSERDYFSDVNKNVRSTGSLLLFLQF